jgi:hypothetical protein
MTKRKRWAIMAAINLTAAIGTLVAAWSFLAWAFAD